jgi:dTDP-4-amino-4,6-dideoxygalactose transaminase
MPFYSSKAIRKIGPLLKSGKVNYWSGNECKKFEQEFSRYLGNKFSLTLSNGSVALELALKALNLKKQDEIIVSPRSFIISSSCTLNLGLKPIFEDALIPRNQLNEKIKPDEQELEENRKKLQETKKNNWMQCLRAR